MLMEIQPKDMTNSNYSVIVQQFLFGQYRIQLTDVRKPEVGAPPGHGQIVREL